VNKKPASAGFLLSRVREFFIMASIVPRTTR
jgi:hypothetical protein